MSIIVHVNCVPINTACKSFDLVLFGATISQCCWCVNLLRNHKRIFNINHTRPSFQTDVTFYYAVMWSIDYQIIMFNIDYYYYHLKQWRIGRSVTKEGEEHNPPSKKKDEKRVYYQFWTAPPLLKHNLQTSTPTSQYNKNVTNNYK